jgi:hypothetical protein
VDPADRWSIDPWGIACARGKWLVGQCVLPSTQTTYSVGWRRWLRYSSEMTIDPYLDNPPSDWFQSRRIYSFPVASVLNFMFKLFFVDKLAASTIGVYLSAMKYRFICENCDTRILHGKTSTSPAHTQNRALPTHHRTPDALRWRSRLALDVGEGQKLTRCIDSPVRRRGGVK